MASCGLGGALKLNLEAKSCELGNQALGLAFGRTAIEVVGPEVVVFGAVLKDVVDRREDRGGDGTDGFLRSTPALQSEEVGFVIAVLLPLGRPGALYQHCLQPWRPLAQAHRFPLAGALVLAGAEASPSDEVPGGREPAHVATDLRQDRRRRQRAHPRYGAQKPDQVAKDRKSTRLNSSHSSISYAVFCLKKKKE